MKYLKLNLQYLFAFGRGKRFATLFLIALPAAIAAAFACPMTEFVGWFIEYPGGYRNYLQLVAQMFSGFRWWVFLVFLFLAVATVSTVMSVNNYLLRTGRLSFRYPMRLLNDNLIPSFFMVFFAAISAVLWFAILILFIFLFHYIQDILLAQTVSGLFFLLAVFGASALMATFLLFMPVMSHNGVKPYRAVGYAVEKIGTVWWKTLLAILPAPILMLGVGVGVSFTGNAVAFAFADILVYDFVFVYLLTLCDIVFFNVEGLPREDTPRAYSARRFR